MPQVAETSEEKEGEERPSWRDKALYRMYNPQIADVADIEKTYQWLQKAVLSDSTEAQSTKNLIKSRYYHTRQDPSCRLCKAAPGTVQHITAGCQMQAC